LDLRAPLEPSAAASAVRAAIRGRVAFMPADRFLAPDIEAVRELAVTGALVGAASTAIGELR
jgi:histidine ammonia-lyase